MKNVKKLFLITICLFSITSVPVQALLGATPQATEGVFKRVFNGVGNNAGWVAFGVMTACIYRALVEERRIQEDEEEKQELARKLSVEATAVAIGSIASCYVLKWIGSKL